MRNLTRGRLCLGGVALALVLATAVAYACTPTAFISCDKPSYRPGEAVTVSGRLFDPKSARPAEARFGARGPVVGRAPIAEDGTWTVVFTLPRDIRPGTYLVYVEARDENDQVVKVASNTLTVTGPARPGAGAGKPAAGHGKPVAGGTDPAGGGRSSGARDGPEGASDRAGGSVLARSVSPRERPVERQGDSAGASPPTPSGHPSERAAMGDLWSGLRSGADGSLEPAGRDAASPGDGSGGRLAVGVGLLGLGGVTLLAGLAVADARRRLTRSG